MHSVRFKQRALLWTLLVLQTSALSYFAILGAFQNPKQSGFYKQVSSEGESLKQENEFLFDTSECISLVAPGRTRGNKNESFSFITNYYFDRLSKNLFVVALEKEYFKYTSTTRNYAVNISFPYENLVHPIRLVPFAWIIGLEEPVTCVEVNTGYKDGSIHDKIVLMKCSFDDLLLKTHDTASESVTEVFLMDMIPQEKGQHTTNRPNLCFRLDATRPHGRLAKNSNRHELARDGNLEIDKPPTLVLCVGGINKFSWIVVRAIELQVRGFDIKHVYLGLNSDDVNLRELYMDSFNKEIQNKLSISLAPASSLDVLFSQGKVPFLSECLFWAKYYEDDLLAAWDGDEMLLTSQSIHQPMNLAQRLIDEIPGLLDTGCHVDLTAQTFLQTTTKPYDENGLKLDFVTDNASSPLVVGEETVKSASNQRPVNLYEKFPFRAIFHCGNYSKSISVVRKVEFISMHLPEACELYPNRGKKFSSKAASFVKRTSQVFLAHFVQAWIPNRYADRCPARRDVKDLKAFESAFSFKPT